MAIDQADRIVGIAIKDEKGVELVFDLSAAGSVDYGESAGEANISLAGEVDYGRSDGVQWGRASGVVECEGLRHFVEDPTRSL